MDRKMVNFIREQYPPGTCIRLNSMEDPYAPILPGTEGEVDFVDDEGQIFTNWNNGRTLPLTPGEDNFTVLPPKLTTLKLYMPLTADLYERSEYGDLDDSSTLLEGGELRGYPARMFRLLARTVSAPPLAPAGSAVSPLNSETASIPSRGSARDTAAWTWQSPPARPSAPRCRGR